MLSASELKRKLRRHHQKGQLTEEDITILEDVVNAGFEFASQFVEFSCRYLPSPISLCARSRHPCLVASEREIDSARRRIGEEPVISAIWTKLKQHCDKLITPGSEDYIDYEHRKRPLIWSERGGHWTLNSALEHLAVAYRLSGHLPYARHAKGIMLALARSRHGWFPLGTSYGKPYKGWLLDNILDSGHAVFGVAVAYDLLYGLLSEEERATIARYCEPYFARC